MKEVKQVSDTATKATRKRKQPAKKEPIREVEITSGTDQDVSFNRIVGYPYYSLSSCKSKVVKSVGYRQIPVEVFKDSFGCDCVILQKPDGYRITRRLEDLTTY